MEAFYIGLTTGFLAVIPVGAVSVLILDKALRQGFRPAAAGAAGAATADTLFAAVALWAGAPVIDALAPYRHAITLIAGGLLAWLGLMGLMRERNERLPLKGLLSESRRQGGVLLSFLSLFLLNCLNPLTIAFFFGAAITAGAHGFLRLPEAPLFFLAGASLAALSWQVGLAWLGTHGHARLSAEKRRFLCRCGQWIVLLIGAGLALSALISYGMYRG